MYKKIFNKKIFNKKIFTIIMLICVVFNVSIIYSAPSGRNFKKNSQEFISRASKIINDNWESDYLSAIVMKIGESEMTVDGEKRKCRPAKLDKQVLKVPLADIAAEVGADIRVEQTFGAAVIMDEGRTTRIDKQILDDAPVNVAEESLGLDIEVNGDFVKITKPFQLKQIIVQTKPGYVLKEFYGANQYADNGNGLYLLQYASEAAAKNAYNAFSSNPGVMYAEPNSLTSASASGKSAGLTDRWSSARISADLYKNYLLQNGKTSELIVAVTDSGVDMSHSHFSGRLVPGYNFIDVNKQYDTSDVLGHGTHVAGTIVDCTPNNVKIMPVKVLNDKGDGGSGFALGAGIIYAADNGAKVINISIVAYIDSNYIRDCVNYAIANGVTVVACAGNDAAEISYESPASFDNVVTVTAVDQNDIPAFFSNYGNAVDIAAPGYQVMSSVPGNVYEYYSGTSMATPHVTAAAAMLLLNNPNLSPAGLKTALRNTVVDCGEPGYDKIYGAGVIDMRLALGVQVPAAGVSSLSRTSITSMASENFVQKVPLYAAVNPANATNKSVNFSSDNEKVAVYKDGRVVITGEGTATVTVTATGAPGGATQKCSITATESEYWLDHAAEAFAGGIGTEKYPYLISTPEQLAKLAHDVIIGADLYDGKFLKIISDIDLSGKKWTPIINTSGSGSNNTTNIKGFRGVLDGGYHFIKNMSCTDDYRGGLFAMTGDTTGAGYPCIIKNLAVTDADVQNPESDSSWGGCSGILVGTAVHTMISNCFTSGSSDGAGLVYEMINSMAVNSYSTANTVKSGFVTISDNSVIRNSYSSGNVSDSSNGAALIYRLSNNSVMTNSFTAGSAASKFICTYKDESSQIERCHYLEYNGKRIWSDSNNQKTSITMQNISFFKTKANFTNNDNWNPLYPWDFAIWDIDVDKNSGLPHLKLFYSKQEPPEFIPGDVNGDRLITPDDIEAARNHIIGTTTLIENAFMAADINGDGQITVTDLIIIRNSLG